MRILLLTQVVPFPPDSGPKIKTYNVLRFLAQRHQVVLLSFARTAAERAAAESLKRWCTDVVTVPIRRRAIADAAFLARSLVTRRPFLIERDDLQSMRNAVHDAVASWRPDAVHADQLSMGQFAADLSLGLRVLDEHNAVWTIVRRAAERERGMRRVLAELEWRKLKRYEGQLCRRFDCVTVVSHEDRLALEAGSAGPFRSAVIPIAVDSDELRFQPRGDDASDVLSVATMFYPPNVEGILWFSEGVFPLIRNALPNTQFLVVGSRPPPHVVRLGSPTSGIVVMGYVQDLDPILKRSAVLVVPLHSGSGMRVKILEAFARGIPIISTTVGVEGIDARDGQHLLVADTPADFAQSVIRLISDRDAAARIASAGRQLVVDRYDWRTALAPLEQIYPESTPIISGVSGPSSSEPGQPT